MNTEHVDKRSWLHLGVCFLCSLLGLFGVGVALGAAVTKEYMDWYHQKHFCHWDLMFDGIGMVAGYSVYHFLISQIWS